jgi:aryl-alcohol dehydrogenase-like predicted oxidoreductase
VQFANADETKEFIHHVVSTGKARTVGLGSDKSKLNDTRHLAPEYTVLQYEYSLLDKPVEIVPGRRVNLHGLFRNMNFIEAIANDNWLSKEIFNHSKLDISKPTDQVELCLRAAQYLNQNGMTIFSATKDHHIKETISVWNSIKFNDLQIDEILNIIRKRTLIA